MMIYDVTTNSLRILISLSMKFGEMLKMADVTPSLKRSGFLKFRNSVRESYNIENLALTPLPAFILKSNPDIVFDASCDAVAASKSPPCNL